MTQKTKNSISLETATERLRKVIEFAKYKARDNDGGDQQAQFIMDDFTDGFYGSMADMWTQVNQAIEFIEYLPSIEKQDQIMKQIIEDRLVSVENSIESYKETMQDPNLSTYFALVDCAKSVKSLGKEREYLKNLLKYEKTFHE